MGGGSLQLELGRDELDERLVGNPQITHFKSVFKRHTNFAIESISQSFQGDLTFGSTVSCTLSRNADLVCAMYIQACVGIENSTSNDVSNVIYEAANVQIDSDSSSTIFNAIADDLVTIPNINDILNTFPQLTGTVTQTRADFSPTQVTNTLSESPVHLDSIESMYYSYLNDILHVQINYTKDTIYADYDVKYNFDLSMGETVLLSQDGLLNDSPDNIINLEFQFARETSPFRVNSNALQIRLDATLSLQTNVIKEIGFDTFDDLKVYSRADPNFTESADTTESVQVDEDAVLEIVLDKTHTYRIKDLPSFGTLYTHSALDSGSQIDTSTEFSSNVLYAPESNFNGDDSFTYYVSETGSLNDSSTVVTVNIAVNAINDPPTIDTNPQNFSVGEDEVVSITLTGAQDVDSNDTSFTYFISSLPEHGILYTDSNDTSTQIDTSTELVSTTLYYAPVSNFNGNDSFTYYASDGNDTNDSSDIATVTIEINAINDPPVIDSSIPDVSVNEDAPYVEIMLDSTIIDPDDSVHTYHIKDLPSHGTLYTDSALGSGSQIDTSTEFSSHVLYYVPDKDYDQNDSFTYFASDGNDTNDSSDIATVTIEINAINDPPVIDTNDQTYDVDEDAPYVEIMLDSTIVDPDDSVHTYHIKDLPSHGTLYTDSALDSGSQIDTSTEFSSHVLYYVPDKDYDQNDSFTYFASDGNDTNDSSDVVTVNITVNEINDPPVIDTNDQTYDVDEDAPYVEIMLDSTIIDPDDSVHTYHIKDLPSHGTLYTDSALDSGSQIDTSTEFSSHVLYYVPDKDYDQNDSFTYFASDGNDTNDSSDIATVTIEINAINDPPVIDTNDQTYDVDEDAPYVEIMLDSTIVDPDDTTHTYHVAKVPSHGTLYTDSALDSGSQIDTSTVLTSHVLYYVPYSDSNGDDSFAYYVSDGDSLNDSSDVVTVNITVNEINDPPVIDTNDQTYDVDEDGVVEITLDSTIVDPDDTTHTYHVAKVPSHGTLYTDSALDSGSQIDTSTVLTSHVLYYVPYSDSNGDDSFAYYVSDGDSLNDSSDVVTVNITVNEINDPPVIDTNDQTYDVDEDGVVEITLDSTIVDPDDTTHTYHVAKVPSHGTLYTDSALDSGSQIDTSTVLTSHVLYYAPESNFNGNDSFAYFASDGDSLNDSSDVVTVNITVNEINDPPVIDTNDQTYDVDEDGVVEITLDSTIVDPDDTTHTYHVAKVPSHGTLYTDSALDSGSQIDTSTVLTSHVLYYVPYSDSNGDDSFTYFASDGDSLNDSSDVVTVNITVNEINDPPVIDTNDQTYDVDEDGVVEITLDSTIVDPDDTTHTYHVAKVPSHGTLYTDSALDSGSQIDTSTVLTSHVLYYAPESNFNGNDSFTYFASDGDSLNDSSDVVTVNITVNEINDPPVIDTNDQTYDVDEDGVVEITLDSTIVDPDDTTHTYHVAKVPSFGALYTDSTLDSGSQIDTSTVLTSHVLYYAPESNFNGNDSFTYFASDGDSLNDSSDVVTVNITVNEINDPPVIDSDALFEYFIDEDPNSRLKITLPGSDVDDVQLTYTIMKTTHLGNLYSTLTGTDPLVNSASVVSNELYYMPGENKHGTDQFNYHVKDSENALSDLQVIVIHIQSQIDPPVANALQTSVLEDGNCTIILSGTNAIEGGNILGYKIIDSPSDGVLYTQIDGLEQVPIGSQFSDATIYYKPNTDFNGADYFTFVVVGSQNIWSDSAQVDITITSVNDNPTSSSFSVNGVKYEFIEIELVGNDAKDDDDDDVIRFQITQAPDNGGTLYKSAGSTTQSFIEVNDVITNSHVYFYTSNDGQFTTEFKYVALDNDSAQSEESSVTVTVQVSNIDPVADDVSVSFVLVGNGVFTAIQLSGSDQGGSISKYKLTRIDSELTSRLHLAQSKTSAIDINKEFESRTLYFSHTDNFVPTSTEFTYQVQDNLDAWSDNATCTLTVTSKWSHHLNLVDSYESYYEIPYVSEFENTRLFSSESQSFTLFSNDVANKTTWSVVIRIPSFDETKFGDTARILFYYASEDAVGSTAGFSAGELHMHITPDKKLGAYIGYSENSINLTTDDTLENGNSYFCVLTWSSDEFLRIRLDSYSDTSTSTYTPGNVKWASVTLDFFDATTTFYTNTSFGGTLDGSRAWYDTNAIDRNGLSLLVTQSAVIPSNSGNAIDDVILSTDWGSFTSTAEALLVFKGDQPVQSIQSTWSATSSSGLVVVHIPSFNKTLFGTSNERVLFFVGNASSSYLYLSITFEYKLRLAGTDFDTSHTNENTILEENNTYLCCLAWTRDETTGVYTFNIRTDTLNQTYFKIGLEETAQSSENVFGHKEMLGGGAPTLGWYDVAPNSMKALIFSSDAEYYKPAAHDVVPVARGDGIYDVTLTGSNFDNNSMSYKITSLPNNGTLYFGDIELTLDGTYSLLTQNEIQYSLDSISTSLDGTSDSFTFVVVSADVESDARSIQFTLVSEIQIILGSPNQIQFPLSFENLEILNVDFIAYTVTFTITGNIEEYTVLNQVDDTSAYTYEFDGTYDSTYPTLLPNDSVKFKCTLKQWNTSLDFHASVAVNETRFDASDLTFDGTVLELVGVDQLHSDSSISNFVHVELDEMINTSINWKLNTNIGHVLFEYVDIEIGGQRIDRHYGEWIEIWNELTQSPGKRAAYDVLVGRDAHPGTNQVTVRVPLQFWFCRNPGLALPLVCLQYHEVKITARLRDGVDQLRPTGTTDDRYTIASPGSDDTGTFLTSDGITKVSVRPRILSLTLWVDYIFLEDQERSMFIRKDHEYLIDQLQVTENSAIYSSTLCVKTKLPFVHPVKELVWVVADTRLGFGSFASSDGNNPVLSARLQLDGIDRFGERDGMYFDIVQPYQHHTNIPHRSRSTTRGINVYSFSLYPEQYDPSGTYNMSQVKDAVLDIKPQIDSVDSCVIRVYAVNYNVLRITQGTGGLAFETMGKIDLDAS